METGRCMMLDTWLAVVFLGFVTASAAEIRCYCNDASCVPTGYMCKSAVGRCFSQLTYERDSTRSVHGCAETLSSTERGLCQGSATVAELDTAEGSLEWPILLCCKNDMCNYMDNIDINIYVTKSNGSKDTTWSGNTGQSADRNAVIPVDSQSQRDLWFKAAVIAVPIAGGFILVLLVLLAVRVLSNDNRRHRQLMQMRHHRSMAKAQLYVADHFYHNELIEDSDGFNTGSSHHRHHSNCRHYHHHLFSAKSKLTSTSLPGRSADVSDSVGDVSVDVDMPRVHKDKVDSNSRQRYEKMRPVSDTSCSGETEGSCDSIVLWSDDKRDKLERAAVV